MTKKTCVGKDNRTHRSLSRPRLSHEQDFFLHSQKSEMRALIKVFISATTLHTFSSIPLQKIHSVIYLFCIHEQSLVREDHQD